MSTVTTPDKFDVQTKEFIDRLCDEVPVNGILMGALDADMLWNVKPLLLIGGVMHVLRFCDPQIDASQQAEMLETYEVSKKLTKSAALIDAGISSSGVWLCRRFCQVSIADRLEAEDLGSPLLWYRWIYQLIQQVMYLHRNDCLHGHILPDNVLIDNDAIFLVDADSSVRSFQQRRLPLCWAPELMIANSALHPQIDVYGLSLVLEPVAKRLGWKELFGLITEMQNSDPTVRPSLDEVMRRFERFCRVKFDQSDLEERSAGETLDTLKWLKGTQTLSADLVKNIQKAVKDQAKSQAPEQAVNSNKKAEAKTAQKEQQASESSRFGFLVLALTVAAIWFYFNQQSVEPPPKPENKHYFSYWESGVRSRMQEVALAAVQDDDEAAQLIIIQDALRGSKRPGMKTQFLKFVFGNEWEQDLTEADREFALKLGLGPLVGDQVKSVRPLDEAHPAIILATIGSIAPGELPESVAAIPVSRMFSLPQPYRGAFELIVSFEQLDFSSQAAQTLARMLYAGISAVDLELFVGSVKERNAASKLLALAMALFSKQEGFEKVAWDVVSTKSTALKTLPRWFTQNPLVDWKAVDPITKLYLIADLRWPDVLSYDLLADCLRHPYDSVRNTAIDKLVSEYLSDSERETLQLLRSRELDVARVDVVLLVSSLAAPQDMKQAMVAKWFAKDPPPELVVAVLGSRSTIPDLDVFSVEAARYLRQKEWQVSLEQLQNLLLHQDPLVRVLAYSRLDPINPVHRELLVAASKVEKNKRILTELMIKLDEVQESVGK